MRTKKEQYTMANEQHVTADPLTPDETKDLGEEIRVYKEIIRALVPNRHALGRIEGKLKASAEGLYFATTITVPLDPSDDELGSRALTNALLPQLQHIADQYASAVSRGIDVELACRQTRQETIRDVLALVGGWSATEDIDARDLLAQIIALLSEESVANKERS
jgi:hypothetical protein